MSMTRQALEDRIAELEQEIEDLKEENAGLREKTGAKTLELDAGGRLQFIEGDLYLDMNDDRVWYINTTDIPAIQDFLDEVHAAADGE